MKPIVTPAWVDTSITRKRLAHVRPFTPDPRLFFSGVNATVAELPAGDKEAICGGIIAMGGQYSSNLTKFTTHVVALNMDSVSTALLCRDWWAGRRSGGAVGYCGTVRRANTASILGEMQVCGLEELTHQDCTPPLVWTSHTHSL